MATIALIVKLKDVIYIYILIWFLDLQIVLNDASLN